jgi:hypothetical protein
MFFLAGNIMTSAQTTRPGWGNDAQQSLTTELVTRYGDGQRTRIQRGITQAMNFWRQEDGDRAVFEGVVRTHFAGDQSTLDALFERFEMLNEQMDGHFNEMVLALRTQSDLDRGQIYPFDELFSGYNPAAHVTDDFFKNKIAFIALLNFPLTTLEERLQEGEGWSRRQWAEVRLVQRFSQRVPAEVNLAISQAASEADQYIAEYNIWMHHLLTQKGERMFPAGMRLLSHWNLRDEIKADYGDPKNGLAKQKMIQQVMERIVTQTIPAIVVNNPAVDWIPVTNEVKISSAKDYDGPAKVPAAPTNFPEPDTRYATLLKTFRASKLEDPFSPTAPTLIARRFDQNREIPEQRVKAMFEQVLSSPIVAKVAKLIETRLGRKLEPFDIWYNGFRAQSSYTQAQLDEMIAKKYPTPQAYKDDMPNLLMTLGFSKERAEYLSANIVIDPARGSGHAWGAQMRSSTSHLRTRVEPTGMNYKGYNIAIHEMGHNVEQTFSLKNIDHTSLQGVPNTAFTEAIAFVFQAQDLTLLGISTTDPMGEALKVLNDFWATYEIAGVAMVDMEVWHWMYDHPNSTPAELKEATLRISKEIWNKYYGPVFKQKDAVLLGVYSHMIHSFLYLPDYPMGHMIAFQIEEQVKKAGTVGSEVERMTTMGRLTPDLWMKKATGVHVGPEAMLTAAEHAFEELQTKK